MKTELASILREAADKIDRIVDVDAPAVLPELPSPALPTAPEGFHPAMMGPIEGCSVTSIKGVALWTHGAWDARDWGGSMEGRYYCLAIGSEIARLNGLEPEAVPSDVEPEAKPEPFVFDWSGIHPSWGFAAADRSGYWHLHQYEPIPGDGRWISGGTMIPVDRPSFPDDWKDSLQVRPVEAKPEKARREWDAVVSRYTGRVHSRDRHDKPEDWEPVRVRESPPGDPTPEHVAELVQAVRFWVRVEPNRDVEDALQPFAGKGQA